MLTPIRIISHLAGISLACILALAAPNLHAQVKKVPEAKEDPKRTGSRLQPRPIQSSTITTMPIGSNTCQPCPGGIGTFDGANCLIANEPNGSMGLLDKAKGFGYLVYDEDMHCPSGFVNTHFKYTLAEQSLDNIQSGGYYACVYTPPPAREAFFYNNKLYLQALCSDDWKCFRDTAQIGVHKKYPSVEWKTIDNKKKWAHRINNGRDFWYHKKRYVRDYPDLNYVQGASNMREQYCPDDALGSYNLKIDIQGKRDFCVLSRPPDPQVTSPCPGSTRVELRHDTKKCYYPKIDAQTTNIRRPKGLWNAMHNTNKWKLVVNSGTDYYQHKNNSNRRVETTCAIGLVPDISITKRTNWIGNNDWCVRTDVPGQNAQYADMSCPAGYVLEKR